MKYLVTGADRNSGREKRILLRAGSSKQATEAANRAGLLVRKVEQVAPENQRQPNPVAATTAHPTVARDLTFMGGAACAILLVLAACIWGLVSLASDSGHANQSNPNGGQAVTQTSNASTHHRHKLETVATAPVPNAQSSNQGTYAQAANPRDSSTRLVTTSTAGGTTSADNEASLPVSATSLFKTTTHKLSPEAIYKEAVKAVVKVLVRGKDFRLMKTGSGFFISSDGVIVTNAHVVQGGTYASVQTSDHKILNVRKIVALDADADLALLKVSAKDTPFLTVADDLGNVHVGESVLAIGSPLGLTNSLSQGIVSNLRKQSSSPKLIQTTASISPGSSGGPLLRMDGTVIGVTTAYIEGGQNLNFAIAGGAIRRLRTRSTGGNERTLDQPPQMTHQAVSALDKANDALVKKDYGTAAGLLNSIRTANQSNPFWWYTWGDLQLDMDNYQAAIDAYQKVTSLSPDFAEAYWSIGVAQRESGNYTEAIKVLLKAHSLSPHHIGTMDALAETYDRMGQFQDALRVNAEAIRQNPADAGLLIQKGSILDDSGSLQEAVDTYRVALRLAPKSSTAMNNLALVYGELGLHKQAVALLEKSVKLAPDATGWANLAGTYVDVKKYKQALEAINEAIQLDPTDVGVYAQRGDILSLLGKFDNALNDYKQAARLSPQPHKFSFEIGQTLYNLQHFDKAISYFSDVVKQFPKNWEAQLWLGGSYVNSGHPLKGIELLKPLSKLRPNDADIQKWLGKAHLDATLYQTAIGYLQSAIKLAPKSADSHYYLAQCYEHLDKPKKAAAAYKACIHIKPYGPAYLGLGWITYGNKKYAKARANFSKAAQLSPSAVAYTWLGLSQEQLKMTYMAKTSYEKALQLHPAYPLALRQLAIIYYIRQNGPASIASMKAYRYYTTLKLADPAMAKKLAKKIPWFASH